MCPFPTNVQLSITIGPAIPAPVPTCQMLSPLLEHRFIKICPALGANSAGFEAPTLGTVRVIATSSNVIRLPLAPTLFIVSSISKFLAQQSCPLIRKAEYSACS
jgi:hypothetical protein